MSKSPEKSYKIFQLSFDQYFYKPDQLHMIYLTSSMAEFVIVMCIYVVSEEPLWKLHCTNLNSPLETFTM